MRMKLFTRISRFLLWKRIGALEVRGNGRNSILLRLGSTTFEVYCEDYLQDGVVHSEWQLAESREIGSGREISAAEIARVRQEVSKDPRIKILA